jgi:hypothetical protein
MKPALRCARVVLVLFLFLATAFALVERITTARPAVVQAVEAETKQ